MAKMTKLPKMSKIEACYPFNFIDWPLFRPAVALTPREKLHCLFQEDSFFFQYDRPLFWLAAALNTET
jgi:hypothetical protein